MTQIKFTYHKIINVTQDILEVLLAQLRQLLLLYLVKMKIQKCLNGESETTFCNGKCVSM